MKNAFVEQILLHTCLSSADRLFDRLPAQLLLVGSSEGIKAALFTAPRQDRLRRLQLLHLLSDCEPAAV